MGRCAVLLLGLIVFVVSGCAHLGRTVEPPAVRLVNVVPAGISFFEQRLRLTLRVTNPNPFGLSWNGCRVKARFNEMEMMPAVSTEHGSVEGLGEADLKVEASVSTLETLRQIMGLRGAQGKLEYSLEGVLFLTGLHAGEAPFAARGTLWDSGAVKGSRGPSQNDF